MDPWMGNIFPICEQHRRDTMNISMPFLPGKVREVFSQVNAGLDPGQSDPQAFLRFLELFVGELEKVITTPCHPASLHSLYRGVLISGNMYET